MGDSLVYLAAPYSSDPAGNTHRSLSAANAIIGEWPWWVPVIPHLSHYWDAHTERPYTEWMRIDRALLLRCDLVVRVGGESLGASEEVRLARHAGIRWIDKTTNTASVSHIVDREAHDLAAAAHNAWRENEATS